MDPNYQYQQQGPDEAFLPDEDEPPLEGLSNKRIRCGFIVKVYLILLSQLAVTAALCWLACVNNSYRDWMVHNSWIIWISLTVTLSVLYPLGKKLCPKIFSLLSFRRKKSATQLYFDSNLHFGRICNDFLDLRIL
jgi:FtsH-binding integral membrane protein